MNNSIFGIASPKFKDLDTNEIISFRCRILKDEQDYKEIMHESIFNLHREWNDIPEHWIYECEIILLEYPAVDRKDLYLQLDSYENKVVEFWRRGDSTTSSGQFRVDEVTPYYLDHPDYPDKIFLRFISAGAPDFLNASNDINVAASNDHIRYPDKDGTFRIIRTGSTAGSLTVNFTVSGTATAGVDYTSIGTSAIIPAGEYFVDVTVVALNSHPLSELTIILTLNSGSYSIGPFNEAIVYTDIITPMTIGDLYLWFPDFNLSEYSAGNYRWIDEVSGITKFEATLGTGIIDSLNGRKVLGSAAGISGFMSPDFYAPEFTFLGILKRTGSGSMGCHGLTGPIGFYASDGLVSYYAYYAGGYIQFSAEVMSDCLADAQICVVQLKADSGGFLKLWINGTLYRHDETGNINSGILGYRLCQGKSSPLDSNPWLGLIGEFFYYSRAITNSEINQIASYLAERYSLNWTNI